jgi:hypothetical protein
VVFLPLVIINLLHPAKSQAAWYSDYWKYRKKLTIDYTKVSGAQTNFPVLVSMTDSSLKKAQTTGNDILFTNSTGSTKLDHEIEKFDATTGELVAWVEVDALSASENTIIYMYYGNPSVASQQNKTGTWESNYVGVWHMSETSGNHNNSTSTSSINSDVISAIQQGTAIGKADGADEFNGSSNYVRVPDSANLRQDGDMTIETWIKMDVVPTVKGQAYRIVDKINNSSPWHSYQLWVKDSDSDKVQFEWYNTSGTGYSIVNGSSLTIGNWYYVVGVKNGNNIKIYLNGSNASSPARGTTTTGSIYVTNPLQLFIGSSSGGSWLDGLEDEVRYSNFARSDGWITTTYNTINSPSTFFTSSGNEEKNQETVLFFGFDEGYGTSINSSTPNNHTGTLAGATKPSWQTEDMCVFGKCLYYNGSTASVTVSDSISNVQSVSFWVKPKDTSQTLLDLDGGTHYLDSSSGTITAHGFSTPTVYVNGQSGGLLIANQWNHVEVTTATKFTASSIKIGNVSSSYLNGFVDEFKLYDYARTAAQVKTDAVAYTGSVKGAAVSNVSKDSSDALSKGLVGYWKMDEAVLNGCSGGEDFCDSSGNEKHGTADVSIDTSDIVSGKFAKGVEFDGVDDEINTPILTISTASEAKNTITFWMYWDGGDQEVPFAWSPSSGYYSLFFNTGNDCFGFNTGAGDCWGISTTGLSGSWKHIVAEFNNGDVQQSKIYVNGLAQTLTQRMGSAATKSLDSSTTGVLGNYNSGTALAYTGELDEVRVYNRALSPGEVQQLYNWAPGPVGYWKMDEGSWINDCSASTVIDSSGNGNHGKVCPAGVSALKGGFVGKIGKAGYFPRAESARVEIQNSTSLDLTNNLTFEAWIKSEAWVAGSWETIVAKGDRTKSPEQMQYWFSINDTAHMMFWGKDGTGTWKSYTDTSQTVSLNTWHHVAVSYSNGIATFYLDGSLTDSGNIGLNPLLSSTGLFSIGSSYSSTESTPISYYFKGLIDDVRAYNYTRTPAQIIEDMNAGHPAPGSPVGSALGEWNFDEGVDNTCFGNSNDACNSGNTGTTLDGAQSGMSVPAISTSGWTNSGKFNKALNFDGINDYVLSGDVDAIEEITVSAWVNPVSTSAGRGIISKRTSTEVAGDWALRFSQNSDNKLEWILWYGNNISEQAYSTSSISTSVWTHVAATYNTSTKTVKFYINGKLDNADSTAITHNLADTPETIKIGYDGQSAYFSGTMDSVRYYNSVLTDDQVKLLYNQGKSEVMGALSTTASGTPDNSDERSFCPPGDTTASCAPVGWWKMDEGSGNTVFDSIGIGNSGTFSSSGISWNRGKTGKGVRLNDSNGFINIPDNDNLSPMTTGQFTAELWVKFDAINNYEFVSKRGTGAYEWYMDIQVAGNYRVFLNDCAGTGTYMNVTRSSLGLLANTWYHAAFTFDNSVPYLKLYLNGVLVGQDDTADPTYQNANCTSAVRIGREGSNYIKGSVDDFRVYNYARSPAQIAWDFDGGAPVVKYDFDECTGSTAYDTSPKADKSIAGYSMTIYPGSSGNTTVGSCGSGTNTEMWNNGTSGKYSASLDFDGIDDYAKTATTEIIAKGSRSLTAFSWGAWIKPATATSNDTIILKGDGANTDNEFRLTTDANGKPQCEIYKEADNTWQTAAVGAVALTTSSWNQVICVYNGTDIRVYQNGSLSGTPQAETDSVTGNDYTSLYVACDPNGGSGRTGYFDGQLDELKVWAYDLTAQQVKLEYNNSSAVQFGQ